MDVILHFCSFILNIFTQCTFNTKREF